MLFAIFMFMALEIDRSNLKQALSDNFLDDLGLSTNGLFYLPYLLGRVISYLNTQSDTRRLQSW